MSMYVFVFCIWISPNIVTDATINTIAESETKKKCSHDSNSKQR